MQKTCSNCANQHSMNCPNSVMCYNLKSKPSWVQKLYTWMSFRSRLQKGKYAHFTAALIEREV